MITGIKTKGLKGLDIDDELSEKNLYIGPNGSGKSSRSLAISLAIMGYIPWASKPKKKPADILSAYGSGDSLTVAVEIKNIWFERKFTKSSKGAVSQRLRVNQCKATKEEFAADLYRLGSPKILDLGEFMDLSDQKKIDEIFKLFPPSSNVDGLNSQIESKEDRLKILNAEEKTARGTIKRLSTSRAGIELPAGTLAEVQAEIEEVTVQIDDVRASIKKEEIAQAEIAAGEKAKKEVEENAKKQAEENLDTKPFIDHRSPEKQHPKINEIPGAINDRQEVANASQLMHNRGINNPNRHNMPASTNGNLTQNVNHQAHKATINSLELVLKTLESAGCSACAAKLIVKRELKKYRSL